MKLYFKMLTAVFFAVLSYSLLTSLFGEKGIYAQRQLEAQVKKMQAHIEDLRKTEISLSNDVLNLSYDYDTIKVCANELGFLSEGEYMLKLVHYVDEENHNYCPGQHLVLDDITFMPDRLIKTLSASVGILVALIQMIIEYRRQKKDDY